MKKRFALFIILLLILTCSSALAQRSDSPPPLLVIDRPDSASLPSSFRTTTGEWRDVRPAMPSARGLVTLRASGSSQFSEGELMEMLPHLGNNVIIVDLREESHGFLNGAAVSWYGVQNWANKGKTFDQVLADERARLDGLRAVREVDIARSKPRHGKVKLRKMTVGAVASEAEVAAANKAGYFRITATDHVRPADAAVDRFVRFVNQLPPGAWLHFHCRAGHGRTTTFLVMYDILRNGKKVTLADIASRQHLLGGVDLLAAAPAKEGWAREAYLERARFIGEFYRYVTTSPDDLPLSWSDWLKTRPRPLSDGTRL
ncbi:protein tyrosine phosphatase [Anaeroselena agilis]|uniref:Protein tyrosine phosphatase n=1 Tax=Anaeroselena agilis TaxID=3063788 RepID=A0ABU3P467_9FIRM|nr:protein tyrosine phosphatase [Selenomonadales bacterium 4137-cl]